MKSRALSRPATLGSGAAVFNELPLLEKSSVSFTGALICFYPPSSARAIHSHFQLLQTQTPARRSAWNCTGSSRQRWGEGPIRGALIRFPPAEAAVIFLSPGFSRGPRGAPASTDTKRGRIW